MFLTDNDIKTLTGYKWKSKQLHWLKQWGIRHFIAADGHPRVLESDLKQVNPEKTGTAPDLSWLKK